MPGLVVVVWHRRTLLREGLALALPRRSPVERAVAAPEPAAIKGLCAEHRAGSCVIDLDDEGVEHWDALANIKGVRGLRLVGIYRSMSLSKARRAFEVGVRAVVGLEEGLDGLVGALRPAALRSTAFGREPEPEPTLADMERAVLRLICEGFTARAAAAQLGLTPSQVDGLKQRVFAKLGVQHQAQAVAVALRYGLLGDPDLEVPERVVEVADGTGTGHRSCPPLT